MSGGHFPHPGTYGHVEHAPATFYAPIRAAAPVPEPIARYPNPFSPSVHVGMPPQQAFIPNIISHNPKRPYRQRRKDPSCDACRERKVKCDATETTSCTECSSRNVRCQFTKDTNRRMSSIKQVQDLERQLLHVRQQLDRYRAGDPQSEASSPTSQASSDALQELPTLGKPPRRLLKAKTPQDLGVARTQLSDVARGLLRPPVLPSAEPTPTIITIPEHDLPDRQQADRLLLAYLEHVHRQFPVVYWPDFQASYRQCYENGGTRTGNHDFFGLLFAVLACGCHHIKDSNADDEGRRYIGQAISMASTWTEAASATKAIVSFLISKFSFESNQRSAALVWAACAIRMVQDRGYHIQGGQWTTAQGEMRKRIWYSFYVWDRILCLELGKPTVIDDDEFDTEYPETIEDEFDGTLEGLGIFQPTLLLAAIHIARLTSPLSKLFKSLCITHQTIQRFEAQLYNCLRLLPEPLHISSTGPLPLVHLNPIIYFQNTRLLLHRHNMSPACSLEQRMQAIGQCVYTAHDTAMTISRTVVNLNEARWSKQMALSASALTCTHLWRCMLFLIFRRMYEPFFILYQATYAIGEKKAVNIAGGRFVLFFIKCLIERCELGGNHDIDQDEELLVYLSADLQSGIGSWVWGNAETGTLLSRRQRHGRTRHASQEQDTLSPTGPPTPWLSDLSSEDKQTWGGWQQVEHAARHLQRLESQPDPQPPQRPNITLPPLIEAVGSSSSAPAPRPQSNSPADISRARMNIASII